MVKKEVDKNASSEQLSLSAKIGLLLLAPVLGFLYLSFLLFLESFIRWLKSYCSGFTS
jgi:hypothetical protein